MPTLFRNTGRFSRRGGVPDADAVEGFEVLLVGVGQGMEIFLRRGDLRMTHPIHHVLQICPASEEPRGVGVAEVVDADVEVDAGCSYGRQPDPGAERSRSERTGANGSRASSKNTPALL